MMLTTGRRGRWYQHAPRQTINTRHRLVENTESIPVRRLQRLTALGSPGRQSANEPLASYPVSHERSIASGHSRRLAAYSCCNAAAGVLATRITRPDCPYGLSAARAGGGDLRWLVGGRQHSAGCTHAMELVLSA